MKIDLTCPVELWQYAMPTEDDADCTFVMNNLSDKVVVSVQVTLKCFDKEDMLLFSQTERIQGLKAGVGERFSIMLLPSQWRDVEGVDLVIEKVWFDDSTIWRRGNAPLTYYKSNALPGGRALLIYTQNHPHPDNQEGFVPGNRYSAELIGTFVTVRPASDPDEHRHYLHCPTH